MYHSVYTLTVTKNSLLLINFMLNISNIKYRKSLARLGKPQKHGVNCFSPVTPFIAKTKDVYQLKTNIKNKELMVNSGCLLLCAFINFLIQILVAAPTINNTIVKMMVTKEMRFFKAQKI